MNTSISICFATDNNYISHTASTMASVLSNAAVSDEIAFYIPDHWCPVKVRGLREGNPGYFYDLLVVDRAVLIWMKYRRY